MLHRIGRRLLLAISILMVSATVTGVALPADAIGVFGPCGVCRESQDFGPFADSVSYE